MSIYAVADLHGNLPPIPEDCDVLLIAGDICPDFPPMKARHWDFVDKTGQRQAKWLATDFREWLQPLIKRPGRVIAVWGNHDFVGEYPWLVPKLPWTLLRDTGTTIMLPGLVPVRIWGTPWVPTLTSWAFYGNPDFLSGRADSIPAHLNILMSHGPPFGVGDRVLRGEHVGDPALAEAILRARPVATICGHIHEARGDYDLEDCRVLNVSAVDAQYKLYDDPFVRLEVT